MLSDFCNSEYYDESMNFMRQVRSEAHTPDSPHSMSDDNEMNSLREDMIGISGTSSLTRPSRSRVQDGLNKKHKISGSCRSLERLSRGPGRASVRKIFNIILFLITFVIHKIIFA